MWLIRTRFTVSDVEQRKKRFEGAHALPAVLVSSEGTPLNKPLESKYAGVAMDYKGTSMRHRAKPNAEGEVSADIYRIMI